MVIIAPLHYLWFLGYFQCGFSSTITPVTTNAITQGVTSQTTSASVLSTNLSCYDCSESFKFVWEPYTECQHYPTHAALRPCLATDRYCKVERVSYKEMTVSVSRGCTKECWHGCQASGFGLTKLKCTSCCLTSGCNIGDAASGLRPTWSIIGWILFALCVLL